MPQIFHPSTNYLARFSIFGAVFLFAAIVWIVWLIFRSDYVTQVNVVRSQPIEFSHEHHVRGLGIDCRYCHTSVEVSSEAGVPPTATCMNCHSQIWADSPKLAPVRESFANDTPIEWTRVHDLPDFVYFNHAVHVAKGVGCVSCHGQVDEMPLMWRAETLHMSWCLDCHREPELQVRPRDQIVNMQWKPDKPQAELGAELVEQYHIQSLTNCSTCHR